MTNKEILIKEFGSADLVEAMPELVLSSLMDAAREDEAGRFKKSLAALRKAVEVIKQWHNADEVWDIYLNNAPEMKEIRDVIREFSGCFVTYKNEKK